MGSPLNFEHPSRAPEPTDKPSVTPGWAAPAPPVFGLFGRASLLADLRRSFDRSNVVLLHGPAGIGKSTAALAYVRSPEASASSQPGPMHWFDFAFPISVPQWCDVLGHHYAGEIKSQLGLDWASLDPARQKELLIRWLRQKPCHVVGSHFDALTQSSAAGAMPGLLHSSLGEWREFFEALTGGLCRVVLTSTASESGLGNVCVRLPVTGLDLSSARSLALAVLQAGGQTDEPLPNVAIDDSFLRLLHGNPQALQWIIPDLRRLQPADVTARWTAQAGHGDPDSALHAALRYRFDALDPLLRRRLALLGLFRGCVSVRILTVMSMFEDAPEILRDLGRQDWLRLLDVLVEMGLLRGEGPAVCGLTREGQTGFSELLEVHLSDHREWLERKFRAVCGRAANQASQIFASQPNLGLSLLAQEQHNLLHALQLAWHCQDWANLKEILGGLEVLWRCQGRSIEWGHLISRLRTDS